MKLNPYVVLLTTGVLMCATVAWSSLQTRVLIARDTAGSDVARHAEARLASVERTPGEDGNGRALEE